MATEVRERALEVETSGSTAHEQTIQRYRDYVTTSFVAAIEPVAVGKAEGATVWDQDGTEYVDCFAGIAVVNAGHRHPKVIAAAKAQMDEVVHAATYIYHVPVVGLLGERLAEIAPGRLQKSFFGNSGAEGIETAMRLAKAYTGKHEFITLTHSFHGRSAGTLSITGNKARKTRGGPYLPGIAFAPAPYVYRNPFGTDDPEEVAERCAAMVEWAIDYQSSGDVAAFIAEPVMGEGGILVPPASYFRRVKEILDRHGILFIADEVQSGFGRTGKTFAVEHFGVEPDIMVLAKGIADGFPLSATIAPPEIADSLKPGEHLSTFGGNPVSCAAGLANIEVMHEERLPRGIGAQGRARHGSPARDGRASPADRRGARSRSDDRRRAGQGPHDEGAGRQGSGGNPPPGAGGRRADRRRRAGRERRPHPAAAGHRGCRARSRAGRRR